MMLRQIVISKIKLIKKFVYLKLNIKSHPYNNWPLI